jgi:hypothetical protein
MWRARIAYPARRNSDPIGKNSVPTRRMMIADYRIRNTTGHNSDSIGKNSIPMRRIMVRDYRIDHPGPQLE